MRTADRMLITTAAAALAIFVLAGCASPPASDEAQPPASPTSELLITPAGASVLDDGDGAELCLGAMAMSYPPQCGGARVVDWDWSQWEGAYEEALGVRWGAFTLTGTFDADAHTFTPTEVRPGVTESAQGPDGGPRFTTPCAPPAGGWQMIDAAKTTDATMQAVTQRAAALPGYAALWVDRSRVPSAGADATPEEQLAETAPYPELTIVNVAVTGDAAAAEAELRKVWGGMLCVSTAERTDAELQAIATEIASSLDGGDVLLSVGADGMAGVVRLSVVHDDGTLQSEFNRKYGDGVVEVDSALQPAG